MSNNKQIRTGPLPPEMRILLEAYPRDAWQAHPNFAEATQNWLNAHQMFRQLSNIICKDAERYLDRKKGSDDFSNRLAYYGNAMVRNLHGHHHWEDHTYFPELSNADPRFDNGLEILESDHVIMDKTLDDFTKTANRAIKLLQLDEGQARNSVGELHQMAQTIQALLTRHLVDEEDLVVPIILHHKLRG